MFSYMNLKIAKTTVLCELFNDVHIGYSTRLLFDSCIIVKINDDFVNISEWFADPKR